MVEEKSSIKLWNPGALANWSILFSPIFGAWLMSLNWKEMGDEGKAKTTMFWAYAGIILIVITILLNSFVLEEGKNSNGLFLIYFLAWRFTNARSQLKHIKETFPDGYTKKGLIKPIGIALGIFLVYFGLIVVTT